MLLIKIYAANNVQFIEGIGGKSLDDADEIQNALSSVLSVLDNNQDKILKKDDLSKYWKSMRKIIKFNSLLPTNL